MKNRDIELALEAQRTRLDEHTSNADKKLKILHTKLCQLENKVAKLQTMFETINAVMAFNGPKVHLNTPEKVMEISNETLHKDLIDIRVAIEALHR
jgi:predicted nuclease with TOPRIM domain